MKRSKDVKLICAMKHKCPVCEKIIDVIFPVRDRQKKFYPFCSEKCKLVDLGRWLKGDYKILADFKQSEYEQEAGSKTVDRN